MAPNLIGLEDAAKQLNITAAELKDRRERQEINGYRDGASWKFKQADVDKFKEELAAGGGAAAADDMGLDDLDLGDSSDMMELAADAESDSAGDESDDSIDVMLLSEAELGESAPGASSTIIGKPGEQSAAESDIKIVTGEDLATSGSDIHLASSGDDSSVLSDESVGLSPQPTSESDKPSPGSDISLGDEAAESADEFSLEDEDGANEGFELAGDADSGDGSSDEMSALGDDDLVLGGSGAGSDITLGAADSGISLANPADSGLSLEEPFDLTDTGASQQQDFDMDSEDMLSLSDDSDSASLLDDSSSELSEAIGDEDFLLEPSREADSEESGSQVIALDEDSIGSDSFLEDSEAGEPMFEDDSDESPLGGIDTGGLETGDYGAAAPAGVTVSREAAFTGLNIASLSTWTLFMLLCGMMMLDMMRNMWSWQENFTVSSSIMDTILGLLP